MKKLHAGMLHHGSAKMPVHEVFVHHFRLPRRGEEMAHFLFFAMQKHSKKPPGKAREDRLGKPVLLIRVWGRNRGNRKKERIKIYDVSEGKKEVP